MFELHTKKLSCQYLSCLLVKRAFKKPISESLCPNLRWVDQVRLQHLHHNRRQEVQSQRD